MRKLRGIPIAENGSVRGCQTRNRASIENHNRRNYSFNPFHTTRKNFESSPVPIRSEGNGFLVICNGA